MSMQFGPNAGVSEEAKGLSEEQTVTPIFLPDLPPQEGPARRLRSGQFGLKIPSPQSLQIEHRRSSTTLPHSEQRNSTQCKQTDSMSRNQQLSLSVSFFFRSKSR